MGAVIKTNMTYAPVTLALVSCCLVGSSITAAHPFHQWHHQIPPMAPLSPARRSASPQLAITLPSNGVQNNWSQNETDRLKPALTVSDTVPSNAGSLQSAESTAQHATDIDGMKRQPKQPPRAQPSAPSPIKDSLSASPLSPDVLHPILTDIFEILDRDANGKLDQQEAGSALGVATGDEQLHASNTWATMLTAHSIDTNNDLVVQLKEWLSFHQQSLAAASYKQAIDVLGQMMALAENTETSPTISSDGWFIKTADPVKCPPGTPTPAYHPGELVDVMILSSGQEASDQWEQSWVKEVSCDGKYTLTWGKGGQQVKSALSTGIEARHLRPSNDHLEPLMKDDP